MTAPTATALIQALRGGNPLTAIQTAKAAATPQLIPSPKATLAVYDQYYTCIDPDCSGRYVDLHLMDPRKDLPAGSLTLDGDDDLAEVAIQCDTIVVPVIYTKGNSPWHPTDPGYRWSGRIDVAHDESKGGIQTVSCELVGDKTWLDRILCWPDPFLPIFIQEPGEWFGIGPGLTVIATLIMEQAFRLQMRLWEIVNDITSLDLNFVGWLTEALYGDGAKPMDLMQMLVTPICVVPINVFTDTSAWIEINGRMDSIWKLVNQQLQDNGFDIDATMWVPGDPQPEGLWFPLTVATCVITLRDRSGFTGPWGPFEGLVVDLTQLEGSLLGNALAPLLNPNNEASYLTPDLGEYIAPTIGVDFIPPSVYFNLDVVESGMIDFSVDHHAPLAYQAVIGGQSPKWINDLINATLEWLIDAITIALGVTGVPNSLLDGIFDNVLFAFSVAENYDAKLKGGPYMFAEKFFPSGEGALSIDSLFSEASALWNIRGYPSAKISFIDNQPFAVGREIWRGILVFYIRRGTLYIDYVELLDIKDSRTERNRVTLQIGDGKSEEGAPTKILRKISGLETYVNIILSGGNLT